MSVSPTSEINDTRTCAQFKTFSFSRFKKTLVCDKIIENMQKKKIEPACYWTAELICAGHYADLWQIFLEYIGKHIHLGNPKIVKYIEMRYIAFRNIMNQGHYVSELHLRNNATIRKIFAEIVVILSLSNRKHSFELIRINRVEEFEIETMKDRLIAPSTVFAESIFQKDDPKEFIIPINEFAYNISQEKHNMLNACYWLEWMIEFDALCRKKKQPLTCQRRKESENVENKYQTDSIWMIWDALINQSQNQGAFIESLMQSLLVLFSIKYTTASCKKNRYLIYFAISLLTEPVPTNIELISDKSTIEIVVNKIDEIYGQIKQNEESPNTEYLFANLEKQVDLEKSIRKIEIMNSMNVLPTLQTK
jgi:hypothetical protein